MNKKLITRLEIQKVSDDYFHIYHHDNRSGNVFKFGWTNTNGAKENPRTAGMKVGDNEQVQTKEYLTNIIAREGVLPNMAQILFNKVDGVCEALRAFGEPYRYLYIYKEDFM